MADAEFEWDIDKSDDRMRRSGFNFNAAKRIFTSDRYVIRDDEAHSDGEERILATGLLSGIFLTVVYVERNGRKRIISAFEADDGDIKAYLETYANAE